MTNAEQTAAIADLNAAVASLTERCNLLFAALEVINKRIAPIAPMLDESDELGAVVKSSDLLGTDEGAE